MNPSATRKQVAVLNLFYMDERKLSTVFINLNLYNKLLDSFKLKQLISLCVKQRYLTLLFNLFALIVVKT